MKHPYTICIPAPIRKLLALNAPVAVGVSGGKDSDAQAIAVFRHLDAIGHTGPRLLIHSDLGDIEWAGSLPHCQRLATFLNCELVVVRPSGGLLGRWETRWNNNVSRYANLECVKLILPWSTPGLRFCTSEFKAGPLCRYLVERWPGQTIISAIGIRRDESAGRAKALEVKPQPRLTSKTFATTGVDWHPIIDWTRDAVIAYHEHVGFPLMEAYTTYGMTRVSCKYCIMSAYNDLVAATTCEDNHHVYRRIVRLEARSTFGFQSNRWLADIAPHLLDAALLAQVAEAKRRAVLREQAEAQLPRHLWYTNGWPTVLPSLDEARYIATVRHEVSAIMEIAVEYTEASAIQERYRALMAEHALREAKKAATDARKIAKATKARYVPASQVAAGASSVG